MPADHVLALHTAQVYPAHAQLVTEEGLQIVGAEYSLESGIVEFLDVESPRA